MSPRGPERATFLERLVNAFHAPFYLGCLFLAFVFGPPGAILLTYVQTSSMDDALARTLYLHFGGELSDWRGVTALAVFSVILFYFLYMIRYMRLKLVAAKPALLPLLPEGEETFHKVFSPVSQPRPPILVGAVLIVLANLQSYPDLPPNYIKFANSSPANLVFLFVWLPLWLMVVGTFIWVYFGSIRGLHELGKKSLKLKSFREDKTLGTRPIGLLSLSFASIYVVGIGLAVLMIIILPQTSTRLFTGLLAVLILMGLLAVFFLPLNTIHKRMLEAKSREQETLRQQLSQVAEMPKTSSQKEVSEALDRLTKIISVDITKEEVEAIPTWPVDARILGQLVTLILTVTGILVANYVMLYVFRWSSITL